MSSNCLEYAKREKEAGRAVVGIMCEYTPRELIIAAGAAPVCLCGGSLSTIGTAEERLPSNLCPLIKSTYGYALQKSNPFLEMADLVVGETTCDGKKKMLELLAEEYPVMSLELPQTENNTEALAHWTNELRQLKNELEQRLGVEITDEKMRQAIGVMNRERSLRRQLAEFMKADAPPLTGRELLDLKSSISGICADLTQYEKMIELLKTTTPEPGQTDRVRVLLTGVPVVHGQERVVDIIEQNGGLIVSMDNCTGVKPILDDVDEQAEDPLLAIAEKYFKLPCPVMTPNLNRLDVLRQLAADYRPHCLIELVWQTCTIYEVEVFKIRRLAEEELGLPYLNIVTDYTPSDSPRITVRIEALFEAVRASMRSAASGRA